MTIQQNNSSSYEPPSKKWLFAWVHNGNMGGSKRFAFEMVRRLAAHGHVIDEYIVRGAEFNGDYLALTPFVRSSTEVIHLRPDMSWMRPYILSCLAQLGATFRATRKINPRMVRLGESINRAGYDYIHIDQYPGCRTIEVLPYIQKPAVVYSHEPSAARYQGPSGLECSAGDSAAVRFYKSVCANSNALSSYLNDRQDISATRRAHLILANSYFSKEVLYQRYGCDSKVCYPGVDCSAFGQATAPVRPMVLSAGRILRAKQHHVIIEAVALIKLTQRPSVVIATPEVLERSEDPEYREELHRMAKDKNVDLTITYRPTEQELASLYSQALALVFVSIMEPFGLVAIEAMASGTPVIGVKEAAIRESVIDGVTGILVDRDADQIAAAISKLRQDKARRAEMSRHAVEHVRAHWTWERTVQRYEEEVRKMLSMCAHSGSDSLSDQESSSRSVLASAYHAL